MKQNSENGRIGPNSLKRRFVRLSVHKCRKSESFSLAVRSWFA